MPDYGAMVFVNTQFERQPGAKKLATRPQGHQGPSSDRADRIRAAETAEQIGSVQLARMCRRMLLRTANQKSSQNTKTRYLPVHISEYSMAQSISDFMSTRFGTPHP